MSDATETDKSDDAFRERLFGAQPMSPPLRDAYRKEIEQMLNPALTPRRAAGGVVLLVVLLACTAGVVRAMFAHSVGTLTLIGWIVLAAAFVYAAFLIARDLWRGKHSHLAAWSVAGALTGAGVVISVVALMLVLSNVLESNESFSAVCWL